ncbi:MAG: hypothetical protein LBK23_04880 [Oscillospiraceae bacterium]|jgi:hypothetical protein|nr:hypothetical protein [Oscillospiraceae bacterium]
MADKRNPYVGNISQGARQDIKPAMQKTDDKRAIKVHRGKDLRTARGK